MSAECSLFIDLLGARLTPDAVSQSSIQSDCAYCHWFSVGCTHDQYLHTLWKSEFSARWELILLSPRLREGGGGRVGKVKGKCSVGLPTLMAACQQSDQCQPWNQLLSNMVFGAAANAEGTWLWQAKELEVCALFQASEYLLLGWKAKQCFLTFFKPCPDSLNFCSLDQVMVLVCMWKE